MPTKPTPASQPSRAPSIPYREVCGINSEQPSPAPCTRCNGEGSIETGIDESPTTLCNKCNGTGEQPSPAQIEKLARNVVATYDDPHLSPVAVERAIGMLRKELEQPSPARSDKDAERVKSSGCRMTGGICACHSGGSFGGCVRERASCCAAVPAELDGMAERAKSGTLTPANCPFCGGSATYLVDRISCDCCLADMSRAKGQSEDDLLAAWGRRAGEAQERLMGMSYADAAQWCRANGLNVPPEWEQAERAPSGESWKRTVQQIICDVPIPEGSKQYQHGFVSAKEAILDALARRATAGTTTAQPEYLSTAESSEVIIDFMRKHGCGDTFASYVRTRMMGDFAQELASCLLAERATAGNAAPTLHCAFCHSTTRDAQGKCTECGKSKFMTWAEITGQIVASNAATAAPVKPFPAPGEWFPVNVLGGPMREYAPGKWENAVWPSDAATAAPGDLPQVPAIGKGGCMVDLDGNSTQYYTADQMREYGRACLASNAGAAPAIPEGWKLVPVAPTTEMIRRGAQAGGIAFYVYEAMLGAAPSNPPVGAERKAT